MERRKKSQLGDVWRRLRKNKLAVISMVLVFILVFSSIFANYIAPYEPDAANFGERLQLPSKTHLLGTDNFGRDILTRIIYGGRTSLLVATMGTIISLVVGCFFGLTAAYYGGAYETVVMRLNDILMAIPTNLMAICISAVLGGGVFNTALAVSIGGIPGYLRLMRASAMSIREQEFVEAARATGSKNLRIMLKHILPNTLSTIIVQATMGIGGCIMAISGLSFIGLGIQPPTPEWGSMLNSGREFMRDFYPLATFPGIAIMLTLFAFNMFGDGLRDALDPRLKQ